MLEPVTAHEEKKTVQQPGEIVLFLYYFNYSPISIVSFFKTIEPRHTTQKRRLQIE